MTNKVFYTTMLGQASSDFIIVEKYDGVGVYVGKKVRASDKHLKLFHEQLRTDGIEPPASSEYVTLLSPVVYGDVQNDEPVVTPKELLQLMYDHKERQPVVTRAKAPAGNNNLFYVGKDYAGRLSGIKSMMSVWDREAIRWDLARIIEETCKPLYRYFHGGDVHFIHTTIRRGC